jgi:hypothetical protein
LFLDLVDIDELKSYKEEVMDEELTNEEVKKAKFRLLRPLNKAYNIIVYIHSSSSRITYFRQLTSRIILINNHTRWNN